MSNNFDFVQGQMTLIKLRRFNDIVYAYNVKPYINRWRRQKRVVIVVEEQQGVSKTSEIYDEDMIF